RLRRSPGSGSLSWTTIPTAPASSGCRAGTGGTCAITPFVASPAVRHAHRRLAAGDEEIDPFRGSPADAGKRKRPFPGTRQRIIVAAFKEFPHGPSKES